MMPFASACPTSAESSLSTVMRNLSVLTPLIHSGASLLMTTPIWNSVSPAMLAKFGVLRFR